jgi:hypothetical protein
MKIITKITLLSVLAAGMLIAPSCDPQKRISGDYSYQSECLGVEMDGSQTLKVWGAGKNREDAVEQAKKNGIRDVLFKGIRSGKPDCNVKPVINEVNAQEKYEDYFNKFFSDNGPYKEFISMKDESFVPKVLKDRKGAGTEVTYGVIVRVLRAELKQRMIKDQILVSTN